MERPIIPTDASSGELAEGTAPSFKPEDNYSSAEPPRPNLLFLAHRVPYPPDKGDRIRSFHVLRCLARHAKVHLVCLADEPAPDNAAAALGHYCERVAVIPLGKSRWIHALGALLRGKTVTSGAFYSPALIATLRAWSRDTQFDSCLASSSGMAPYLEREELIDVPGVVDLVDVDSEKWLEYASVSRGWRSWIYGIEGKRLREFERGLPERARAVTLVSQAEADLYRSFCQPGRVHAVTNGVDLDYYHPQPVGNEESCVFVGALDYRPNVDAVCWFCDEVWPALRDQRPQARLLLVGRRPVSAVERLAANNGVELFADVPDVRPLVGRATVAIAPLRIARGVQNKVLEALAMSKAVVASPQALAGIQAKPAVHLLSATSVTDWVQAVNRLWDDSSLRSRLGRAGRAYVEKHHRWEVCLEVFSELLGLTA
jgi:polysaccharide biosynthesis protein PslH